MDDRIRVRAGLAAAVVLAADALAHVYWMTGSTWPAQDSVSLSRAVLNVEVPFTPRGLLAPFVLLVAAVVLILARVGRPAWLGLRVPAVVKRWGIRVVGAGLLIRAAVGVVWALGIGASPSAPFYWLNLLVYTPVCLVLFACVRAQWRAQWRPEMRSARRATGSVVGVRPVDSRRSAPR